MVQVEPRAHGTPFTVVDAATLLVTVVAVAATGTCPAVMPDIPVPLAEAATV